MLDKVLSKLYKKYPALAKRVAGAFVDEFVIEQGHDAELARRVVKHVFRERYGVDIDA